MAKNRGRLTEIQKVFIVQRLACFDTPSEAAKAFKEEHGIEITPQAAEGYDPTKRAGQNLSKRLRETFEATRKRFLEKYESEVPEANKAVRLKHLAHAARAFKGRNNFVGMANMLEQIAKETGGSFTNQRQLTGKDGGPIAWEGVPDEELDQKLNKLLATMAGGGGGEDSKKGGGKTS
ncbi:DUF2280 domain-containing protein [Fodinicurvata sediminis]|uniref:DUF2280 domain-containing protein n=1 Tax=Fodinicurvata sediminis TaxID=1121832 RepID=UPI0003B4A475|nr:DUF2280 domain-containing protein [Fodinicurvata sediminis]